MLNNSYHNTTKVPAQMALVFEIKARTQEQIVYEYFCLYPKNNFIRDEIILGAFEMQGIKVDKVSVGRAMTNLMNAGKLQLLDEVTRKGHLCNRTQHAYKLI